jgi:membrane protein DedA with SNARE-associated domain
VQDVWVWFGGAAQSLLYFGYLGVLVALFIEGLGLPFPGDAFLVFYGFGCTIYASHQGNLHFLPMLCFSILGYTLGTTVAYLVARCYGTRLFATLSQKAWFPWSRMEKTLALMNKYGSWLLIPGRFLPGIRTFSSYAAGLSRMPFRNFLLYTLVSAVLWCSFWAGLGYWFGENIREVFQTLQTYLFYVSLGVAVCGLIVLLIRKRYFTQR